MKSNGFSRRGLLMGAATLAVSRLKAADDTTLPTRELQQMAEGVSGASAVPPFARSAVIRAEATREALVFFTMNK